MGKIATGQEPRALIPARSYFGIVCGVFDLGTQDSGQYGPNAQYIVMFELHTKKGPFRDEEGEVATISSFMNLYLGSVAKPSPLLKLAQAIERRSFTDDEIKKGWDIETILGKAIRLTTVHKKNGAGVLQCRVDTTVALDEDDDEPMAVLDDHYFEITPAIAASKEVPDFVPKFVADYVKKSAEFSGKKGAAQPQQQTATTGVGTATVDEDEDIPF